MVTGFVMLYVFPLECELHEGKSWPVLSTTSSSPLTVPGAQGDPSQTNIHLLHAHDGPMQAGMSSPWELMVGLG